MPSPETPLKQGLSLAARAGYVAKGIVYLLIGGLTSLAAAGLGGENVGSKEAINQLIARPFGDVMLGLLGAGLFGYGIYCLINAGFRDASVD